VELPQDILGEGVLGEDEEDVDETGEQALYRVNASGHGLAEASHDFAQQAIQHAMQAGLVQTSGDKAMLHWRPEEPRPGAVVVMGLITDDMPQLFGPDEEAVAVMQRVDAVIDGRWKVTRQSTMEKAIGIQLVFNGDGSITLRQLRHIEDLRAHCYPDQLASDTREVFSPLPVGYETADPNEREERESEKTQEFYRTGVGLISYTLHSRPMDQCAYSWLSRRTGRAKGSDVRALCHFAAYAHTTRAVEVTYHPKGDDESGYLQVRVAPDAAYRRHEGGHSHLGVGVLLAGSRETASGFIDWLSRMERGAPSLGVPEAENKALVEGIKLAIAHRRQSMELGDVQEGATVLLEDNDTVRRNAMGETGKATNMRHAAQLMNFCQYHVTRGTVTVERTKGTSQPGDGMTKLFGPTMHWRQAAYSMGSSEALEEVTERVRRKYGRRTEAERQSADSCSRYEQERSGSLELGRWTVRRERVQEIAEEEEMSDSDFEMDCRRGLLARIASENSEANAAVTAASERLWNEFGSVEAGGVEMVDGVERREEWTWSPLERSEKTERKRLKRRKRRRERDV
jgi:hypothetical protein